MSWVIVTKKGPIEVWSAKSVKIAKGLGLETYQIKEWLDKVNKEVKNEQTIR